MVKSIGLNKTNTCVFISGTGSNLENLIKFSLTKKSPININLIFCNKVNAKGLMYANKYNIKKKIYFFKKKSRRWKKNIKRPQKKQDKINLSCGFYENIIKKFY